MQDKVLYMDYFTNSSGSSEIETIFIAILPEEKKGRSKVN